MKKCRVLVVQYKISYLKPKSNLLKIKRILNKYKFINPDLVIFPEYSLTGPLYGHYDYAFKENDETFQNLSDLAKEYNTCIIPGSYILKKNNGLFNSTCLIDNKGRVSNYYDKQNLWSSERRFLKKGVNVNVVETNFGKIAIQICADLHSSFLSAEYRKNKPDIIINLSMWSHEDIKACVKQVPENIEFIQTETLVKARAIENHCYMIFCNFANNLVIKAKSGRQYKETSIGNSMIVNPYGEIITKTSTNKEEILFATLNFNKCHWSKYTY